MKKNSAKIISTILIAAGLVIPHTAKMNGVKAMTQKQQVVKDYPAVKGRDGKPVLGVNDTIKLIKEDYFKKGTDQYYTQTWQFIGGDVITPPQYWLNNYRIFDKSNADYMIIDNDHGGKITVLKDDDDKIRDMVHFISNFINAYYNYDYRNITPNTTKNQEYKFYTNDWIKKLDGEDYQQSNYNFFVKNKIIQHVLTPDVKLNYDKSNDYSGYAHDLYPQIGEFEGMQFIKKKNKIQEACVIVTLDNYYKMASSEWLKSTKTELYRPYFVMYKLWINNENGQWKINSLTRR